MSNLRLELRGTAVQPSAFLGLGRPDVTTTHLAIIGLGAYAVSLRPMDVHMWGGGTDASGGIVAVAEANLMYRTEPPANLLERVDREETWFAAHRASLAASFGGRYVAVHEGRVVDADADLSALVDRFFRAHGNVPCYFDFVGDEPASALAAVPGASH